MDYFLRVHDTTPTRLWVNNPTMSEVASARAHGAVACTTNPAFAASLLRREPHETRSAIRSELAGSRDDDVVAAAVQRTLAGRICEAFVDRYESSGGREGMVTIQGAPEADTETEHIVEDARATRALATNAIPKIPATEPGLAATETLLAEGHPLVLTEVFSLAQLAEVARRYERATERLQSRPVVYVAAITGIFGDHLRAVAAQDDGAGAADAEAPSWAGVAFARRCHAEVVRQRYPFTLLYGGARQSLDFTGLVGGPEHITINHSTIDDILAEDPPVEWTIERPVPPRALEDLQAFDAFRRAMADDGLATDEFEAFGPVQHFRDAFIDGWTALRAAIAEERSRQVAMPTA